MITAAHHIRLPHFILLAQRPTHSCHGEQRVAGAIGATAIGGTPGSPGHPIASRGPISRHKCMRNELYSRDAAATSTCSRSTDSEECLIK